MSDTLHCNIPHNTSSVFVVIASPCFILCKVLEGTLNRYLADINQQAEQMFHRVIKEMVEKQGVTETLKAEEPWEWIGE